MTRGRIVYGLASLLVASLVAWILLRADPELENGADLATLTVPELEGDAAQGGKVFDANCAVCHGENAAGSDRGPPLVHRIYEPSHHSDMAFMLAVRRGVRAHHWQYGDMPAIDGVTDEEVQKVTAYVRALQRANGIH